MIRVLGIDPGINGALAFICGIKIEIRDMPIVKSIRRTRVNVSYLVQLVQDLNPDHAFVEFASARPGQGVSSCFNYGFSNGIIHGVLAALQVPMTIIHPVKWKRELQVPRDKKEARMRASQLMPHGAHLWPLAKHDGRAEAALIAYYGAGKLGKTWEW